MRLVRLVVILGILPAIFWISGCMERMFYQPTRGPTPLPLDLREMGAEGISFESVDGTRLSGWFIPAQRGDEPRADNPPTILHIHGNAGNIESHIYFTEYLPPAGFNLFIFDYRGYGQSEGSATRRGPLIADTEAALDYLFTRDDVDRNRIGMYGQSLGGSIGLSLMARRPEIRAAVIESAFTSWRDIAADVVGGHRPGWIARTLATMLIRDADRADAAISQINRPILLLHGDADRIIPVSHSRALKQAGGPRVELVEFPGGDHNTLRDTHPRIDRITIDFFQMHLSGAVDSAAGDARDVER